MSRKFGKNEDFRITAKRFRNENQMKSQRGGALYVFAGAAKTPVTPDVGRQWKTPPEPLMRL
jgi:hypothetical protein